MNRDQGVEPVTMCLVCLRPAPQQHGTNENPAIV